MWGVLYALRSAPTGLRFFEGDANPGVRCASPGLFSFPPYGRRSMGASAICVSLRRWMQAVKMRKIDLHLTLIFLAELTGKSEAHRHCAG
jgi:hypothetical protein